MLLGLQRKVKARHWEIVDVGGVRILMLQQHLKCTLRFIEPDGASGPRKSAGH